MLFHFQNNADEKAIVPIYIDKADTALCCNFVETNRLSLLSKASALKATELNATTAKATLLNALEMSCSYLDWPR